MKKICLAIMAIVFAVNLSYAQWTNQTGTGNYYLTSGNVGIGTSNSVSLLDVNGTFRGTADNTYLGFDAGTDRFGIVKKYGFYGQLAYGSAATFTISQSNGTTIAADNTFIPRLTIDNLGNIGIGTINPGNKFDVQGGNGSVYNTGTTTSFRVGSSTTGKTYITLSTSADLSGYGILQSISAQGTSYGNTAINPNGGNVLIGKAAQTNAGYKLDVAGSVRANEIVVNTTGADFVFHPAYRLYPLSRLKKYIDQNRHLPEIASAREMQANGLNLGDNQVKLLQKVEELTLYLVAQNKQIAGLQKVMQTQQREITELQHKKK